MTQYSNQLRLGMRSAANLRTGQKGIECLMPRESRSKRVAHPPEEILPSQHQLECYNTVADGALLRGDILGLDVRVCFFVVIERG